MRTRTTWIWIGLFGLGLMTTGGCLGRAISEGVGKITGAKGITVVIEPVSPVKRDIALVEYQRFEVATFADDFGGRTPPRLIEMLPAAVESQLAKDGIINHAGGKILLIRGKIIHYEDATRATSQVFGPFEEVVARVELVDKASNRVLGVANCIGRSQETVNQGVDKKTPALAEAIAGWIAQHYPKSE